MKKFETCNFCNGSGVEHSPDYHECSVCHGYGVIVRDNVKLPKPKTESDLREYLMQWHKSKKDNFSFVEFLNWINS